jgi:K(+)-stimulated pyrophosphate-energized sodium pump
VVKVFTSTQSAHTHEVVTASREGGASLNVISGLVAGNFSSYWMGIIIVALMAIAFGISTLGLGGLFPIAGSNIDPSPVFAFGLVAFGFLGWVR